jgi:multiple sugar transport system substrate-binding protein
MPSPALIEYWADGINVPEDRDPFYKWNEDVAKKYPWIHLTFVEKPYAEIRDRLISACLARNPPHMAQMVNSNSYEFIPFSLEITQEMLDKIGVKTEDFNAPSLSTCKDAEGKLYGLPLTSQGMAFIWHKGICEKAGINSPPTTWEELADFSKKITDYYKSIGQEVYGYNLCLRYNHGNTWFRFLPIVYSYGGTIVEVTSSREAKVTINSQPVIDAVKLYVRMYAIDKSVPPTAFTDTLTEGLEYMLRGKVAYAIGHTHHVKYLIDKGLPEEKIGYDLYPVGPKGRFAVLGGWNWHLFKDRIKTKDELEACLLALKVYYEPDRQASWFIFSNPAYIPAYETSIWKEAEKKYWYLKPYVEMAKYAVPSPPIAEWGVISLQIIPKMLQYACSKEKTPEEAVQWAEQEIKNLLKK